MTDHWTRFVTCFLLISLCLAAAVHHVAGQGLLPSQSTTVGASNTLLQLQELYSSSQAWRRAFKQQPKSACSKATGTSLCAAAAIDAVNTYAQLMLATSPSTYSSTADSRVKSVSPAQDQGPCNTCAAFAVAAAAETAIASALQVDVQLCSISVQALHFCPPGRPGRSCSSGWNLAGALEQLQHQAQSIPTASCLPYQPDLGQELTAAQLCTNKCSSTSWRAGQGFSSLQITSYWEAQMHIRRFGAVVSRFDVYSDLKPFFADKRNTKAVYRPSPRATFEFAHAVTLIGYNNQKQYWLVKNSWGSNWGDGGMFKVAYGVCSVLTPGSSEAYGIIWAPYSTPKTLQLPVTSGPKAGCYRYTARPGDYLSGVAWLAGIPLQRFMLDNTASVRDLDAPLQGTQLLLCNPKPGAVYEVKSGSTTAAAAAPPAIYYRRYFDHDSYGDDLTSARIDCSVESCCIAACNAEAACVAYVWAYGLPQDSTWYHYCWLKAAAHPKPLSQGGSWATHGLMVGAKASQP